MRFVTLIKNPILYAFIFFSFLIRAVCGAEEETEQQKENNSLISDLPINDRLLRIKKSSLPENELERQYVVEEYFSEHLPTVTDKGDHFEIRLERPSSPYGSYMLDPEIHEKLGWWKPGTRVRDIPVEKRFLNGGIFVMEDQWTPLSWSMHFQKRGAILEELILLHVDDHKDMMSPRIGQNSDGQYFDFITKNSFSLLNPESVTSAILSGALGKGSILSPLIWQVDKIHVRHLTVRPNPYTYSLKKTLVQDTILGDSLSRIILEQKEIEEDVSLLNTSNYIATSNIDTWLNHLPGGVPIFLHIDMDFFNNRFDGNSSWQDADRQYDPSLEMQQILVEKIFNVLKDRDLEGRIVDVSLCLSPSFFPAEFWQPVSEMILNKLRLMGLCNEII